MNAPKLLLVDLHPAMVDALSAVAEFSAQNALLEKRLTALSEQVQQLDARLGEPNGSAK